MKNKKMYPEIKLKWIMTQAKYKANDVFVNRKWIIFMIENRKQIWNRK